MGKVGKLTLKGHIVLCGFTKSTEIVIEEMLRRKGSKKKIILVTQKPNPDINGVIYVNGDFSDVKVLKMVNIKESSMCVVFAEHRKGDEPRTVDMRTTLTIFNIENTSSKVHTIAEIIDKDNAAIITERIKGDEIIYKETTDANLISTCIRHPHIGSMIYELVNIEGQVIKEKKSKDFGLKKKTEYVFFKKHGIEKGVTFLGFIDENNKSFLAPKNSEIVSLEDRLIYLDEN